jgi:hypothetical protein
MDRRRRDVRHRRSRLRGVPHRLAGAAAASAAEGLPRFGPPNGHRIIPLKMCDRRRILGSLLLARPPSEGEGNRAESVHPQRRIDHLAFGEIRKKLDLRDGNELEARVFPGSLVLRLALPDAGEPAWERIRVRSPRFPGRSRGRRPSRPSSNTCCTTGRSLTP